MGDSDSDYDTDYDTEKYDDMDEYLSTDQLTDIFEAVKWKGRPNCYSFRVRGVERELAPKFPSIWAAAREGFIGRTDLGAIEEAQIKLIKKRINKNIKKKLHRAEAEEKELHRAEAEKKAFACLEKDIGRSPVHRRRSTFGGGKSTRKKRKKRKTRRKKRKRRKKRTKRRGKKRARRR